MALPTPALGLVVHYGFVWAGAGRRRPPDAGKDRPCLIVNLRTDDDGALRVTYLPISHTAPRAGEIAVAVPRRVALHLGLTAERSHIYASYAVEDEWPYDLAPVPGVAGRFDHGFIAPRLFEAIAAVFEQRLTGGPDFVYRR